jgi:EAL domain-containing protein (putative c-di-GMP-specific phosphodiesterase class I)
MAFRSTDHFETVEDENIINRPHLVDIFRAYKRFGFQTAIDDFGAGHSGLALSGGFQPDPIKLEMGLVRGSDTDFIRQCNRERPSSAPFAQHVPKTLHAPGSLKQPVAERSA